jgi:hypothetical protein
LKENFEILHIENKILKCNKLKSKFQNNKILSSKFSKKFYQFEKFDIKILKFYKLKENFDNFKK